MCLSFCVKGKRIAGGEDEHAYGSDRRHDETERFVRWARPLLETLEAWMPWMVLAIAGAVAAFWMVLAIAGAVAAFYFARILAD